jgi:hypothetical protein
MSRQQESGHPQGSGSGQPQGGSQPPQQGVEESYQDQSLKNTFTCHRDRDRATAVCGECGDPLCETHQKNFTDPLFTRFKSGLSYFAALILGLLVFPAVWLAVDPMTAIENSLASNGESPLPAGTESAVFHSIIILAFFSGLTMWMQSATRKTSVRFLQRSLPERILCEDCYADTSVVRLLSVAIFLVSLLVFVAGAYFAWSSGNLSTLRLSAVAIGIYILRYDIVMLTSKLLE